MGTDIKRKRDAGKPFAIGDASKLEYIHSDISLMIIETLFNLKSRESGEGRAIRQ